MCCQYSCNKALSDCKGVLVAKPGQGMHSGDCSATRRVEYTKTEVGIEYTGLVNIGGELTGTKEVLDTRRVGSPGNPIVLAQEWQGRVDNGEVSCKAALGRKLGISRAHVTRVLKLQNLSEEVRETIADLTGC